MVQTRGRNPVKQAEEALYTNSLHTHLKTILFQLRSALFGTSGDIFQRNQPKTKRQRLLQRSHPKKPSFNSLLLLRSGEGGGVVTSLRQDVLRRVGDVTTHARHLRCKQKSVAVSRHRENTSDVNFGSV